MDLDLNRKLRGISEKKNYLVNDMKNLETNSNKFLNDYSLHHHQIHKIDSFVSCPVAKILGKYMCYSLNLRKRNPFLDNNA